MKERCSALIESYVLPTADDTAHHFTTSPLHQLVYRLPGAASAALATCLRQGAGRR
jgi:hypothetical protein